MAKRKKTTKIEVEDPKVNVTAEEIVEEVPTAVEEEMEVEEVLEEEVEVGQEAGQTEKKSEKKSNGIFSRFTGSGKKDALIDELTESNEKLQQESGELKDKYVRLLAEFDNFKRRTAKERVELIKTAGQDVLLKILPVLDDFERAFKAEGQKDSEAELDETGFTLIYNKFKSNLTAQGLKVMEAQGADFDAEFHEAIAEIPAPSEDLKGKVVDVIENGYYLNDKIIRYAKVVVGK